MQALILIIWTTLLFGRRYQFLSTDNIWKCFLKKIAAHCNMIHESSQWRQFKSFSSGETSAVACGITAKCLNGCNRSKRWMHLFDLGGLSIITDFDKLLCWYGFRLFIADAWMSVSWESFFFFFTFVEYMCNKIGAVNKLVLWCVMSAALIVFSWVKAIM